MFVWDDLDDDSDVIDEYRTYEGHREDITHMAGRMDWRATVLISRLSYFDLCDVLCSFI